MRLPISVLLALAALATTGCLRSQQLVAKAKPSVTVDVAPAAPTSLPGELNGDTVGKIKHSIAFITDLEDGEPTETGTGFLCDNPRWIVTGRHVVTGTDDDVDACKVTVGINTADERTYRIQPDHIHVVKGLTKDEDSYGMRDVAILELPEDVKGEPLKLASSESLHETQAVWSCGFPDGDSVRTVDNEDLPSPSFHVLRVERIDKRGGEVMVLQLSGSPTHGDSGEPVVNSDGEVVGVIEALEREDATILYAVPTSPLLDLMAAAKTGKSMVASKADSTQPAQEVQRKTPAPANVATSSGKDAAETLFDAMASRRITDSELARLSAKDLTVLENVPYAKRGLIFARTDLIAAFGAHPWYHPTSTDAAAIENQLNDNEKANVAFIRSYKQEHHLIW